MGHRCDFCGEQRAIVYCRSDAASLCLSCDRNVHSANALSRRHSRTLLCERCSDQPASVRCVTENSSLCQNCDWTGHSTSALPTSHERQPIYGYTGCPSAEELSRIWSFVLDESSREDYACEEKMGLMSIEENTVSDYSVPRENNRENNKTNDADSSGRSNAGQLGTWTGSSSTPVENPGQRSGNQFSAENPMQRSGNQFAGSGDSTTNKPSCLGLKGFELDEDDICNDFDVADCEMAFENYEELFGVCQNNPEQDIVNSGIDSLFGARDMSAVDSGGQGGSFPEGSAAGKFKLMQSACSDQVSGDSAMSAKTEPNFCYSGRPAQSNISFSFSGLGGDSGDYQDSGVSSMLLMDEPSWLPPGAESSFPSANRDSAVMRYKEKKKARKFEKKIRYESRKARADVRKRVKGRFVKAGDAYDYDPLSQTRSC